MKKGFIIKTVEGNQAWTGSTWMAESWVEYVKVYRTLTGAQRMFNQLDKQRPGASAHLFIKEV